VGEFKASHRWLTAFMKRFKFSNRTKSNQGQVPPENIQELTKARAKELGVSTIWNADQTPVNFEMLPSKTVDKKGTRTAVWVRCAGKEKERVSVMLLANSDGVKKKPCVVMKQVAPTTAEAFNQNKSCRNGFDPLVWKKLTAGVPSDVQVFANAKAWFTSEIIVKWLNFNFAFNTAPLLLLLDEFTGHRTGDVEATAKKLNITIMMIPPGLTSKAQPADVSWNKPFKMREYWTNKLVDDMRNMSTFKASAPSRQELLGWILNGWDFLSEDTIKSGFVKSLLVDSPEELSPQISEEYFIPDSMLDQFENIEI